MEVTGPTGPYSPDGPWGAVPTSDGPTGGTGPTVPDPSVMAMFPSASTESLPAPFVVDLEELLQSYGVIQTQEATDRATLNILMNETRETLRPQMFEWAAAGFPAIYVVQRFTVTPPAVCADGVSRSISEYVVYLLGQDMATTIAGIQALCVGVVISYSFDRNTLRIHVSKA